MGRNIVTMEDCSCGGMQLFVRDITTVYSLGVINDEFPGRLRVVYYCSTGICISFGFLDIVACLYMFFSYPLLELC